MSYHLVLENQRSDSTVESSPLSQRKLLTPIKYRENTIKITS